MVRHRKEDISFIKSIENGLVVKVLNIDPNGGHSRKLKRVEEIYEVCNSLSPRKNSCRKRLFTGETEADGGESGGADDEVTLKQVKSFCKKKKKKKISKPADSDDAMDISPDADLTLIAWKKRLTKKLKSRKKQPMEDGCSLNAESEIPCTSSEVGREDEKDQSADISSLMPKVEDGAVENPKKSSRFYFIPSRRKTITPTSQEELCRALKCSNMGDDGNASSVRGILKSAACGSALVPPATCARNAIAFSQRQMRDIESIAGKLVEEVKSMRCVLKRSLPQDDYEARTALDCAAKVEETTSRWLSMMTRDCNRFCKIMRKEGARSESAKKIVFADEVGKVLCDVRVLEDDVDAESPSP